MASALGDSLLDARECAKHRALFAAHRAAGHDDLAVWRNAEETQHALARLAMGRRGRKLQRIELQAARDGHPRRVGAEVDQPARRFLALHAESVDVGEHAPEERTDEPIPRIRPRRDASVDDHRLHAPLAAYPQQVRPDLGLHHDEDPRLHQIERPPHDERPVEREVEHAVDMLQALPRHLLPGDRRRRQEQAQPRILRLEIGRQRARGQRLADRDGMNPDRLLAVDVERDRQEAQPLPQAADVFLVADRLIHEIRRHDDEDGQRQQAVGEVHLRRYG